MQIRFLYLRSILFVYFLTLSIRALAPVTDNIYLCVYQPISPFERLIKAVLLVESSGDTMAFNINEEAVGGLQIRPIRLLDYNQRTGKNYKMKDCYDFRISKEIFLYFAKLSGTNDYESIARSWNGSGITTLSYWVRVKSFL